jgi:hypothetical protein
MRLDNSGPHFSFLPKAREAVERTSFARSRGLGNLFAIKFNLPDMVPGAYAPGY